MHADHDSKLRTAMQAIAKVEVKTPYCVAIPQDQLDTIRESAFTILEELGALHVEEAQPGWFRAPDGSMIALDEVVGVSVPPGGSRIRPNNTQTWEICIHAKAASIGLHFEDAQKRASFLEGMEAILARRRGRIITQDDVLKEGL